MYSIPTWKAYSFVQYSYLESIFIVCSISIWKAYSLCVEFMSVKHILCSIPIWKAYSLCAVFLPGKHIHCVQYSYLESIFLVCSILTWKKYSLCEVFLPGKHIPCVQYSYLESTFLDPAFEGTALTRCFNFWFMIEVCFSNNNNLNFFTFLAVECRHYVHCP